MSSLSLIIFRLLTDFASEGVEIKKVPMPANPMDPKSENKYAYSLSFVSKGNIDLLTHVPDKVKMDCAEALKILECYYNEQ